MRKIIDCFTFYNELKMLEFRLSELNEYVDYFIIVEATKTHSGKEKKLFFEENKLKFKKFLHKIIHVVVDFPEDTSSWLPWDREKYQRNSISIGLNKLNLDLNDLIFISDCDEIWNTNIIDYIPNTDNIFKLEQDFYFYNLESIYTTNKWTQSRACKYSLYKDILSPDNIRMAHSNELSDLLHTISDAGWHFSYFGDIEFIKNKIANFAHQEYNNEYFINDERIKDCIKNKKYLFFEDLKDADIKHIPLFSNDNLPKKYQILLNLKIELPKSISICLIGGDPNITSEQEELLKPLRKKYNVSFHKRSDSYTGFYASYSQIVNELVNESTNDFLFFMNPKVKPTPDQIEEMLLDLCSGFCWTSKIAFGLWGTTKELFREIGLFDETFIGSEWEDIDFICRLKQFGKAVKWQYQVELYPQEQSKVNDLRGLSHTVFNNKWIEGDDNILYLDYDNSEHKKLKSYQSNYYISNSWSDFSESVFMDNNSQAPWFKKDIRIKKFKKNYQYSNSKILINSTLDSIKIEFLCDYQTEITICFINSDGYSVTFGTILKSNTWYANRLFVERITEHCEIKIFHDGSKIYHNKYVFIPIKMDIEIGLKITNKIEI